MAKRLRIGCGGGFWGDSAEGPAQLVRSGAVDVLVIDYLAEITMSLLARLRAARPEQGYVPDFVQQVIKPLAPAIREQGIRVVANAGGVNPLACGAALEAVLKEAGVPLSVAVVLGDDLLPRAEAFRAAGVREMASGEPLPAKLLSMNAYLGARPIAAALAAGADIVVTGRCVDSALVLGPLIQAFGWAEDDWDRLAAGSLAGHIVECGSQATGGLVTDWRRVEGWDRMGFPIVECEPDGSFVVTKPEGTGGLVAPETVAEQIVYEIGDPRRYLLPDVTCDFSEVRLTQVGPDRVAVAGARGLPPTSRYKVSATFQDGFKAVGNLTIGGREAAAKAARTGEALLARTRRFLAARGLADYRRVSLEVLGSEAMYGPRAQGLGTREAVLKLAVHHDAKEGAEVFSREFLTSATAMAQGTTGFAAGRPKVSPVVRLFSCLVEKAEVPASLAFRGETQPLPAPLAGAEPPPPPAEAALPPLPAGERAEVPLIALAYGRSGDKGDDANIGVLARDPAFLPAIAAAVTPAAVQAWFAHLAEGPVERFAIPGLAGFNFLIHRALDGGGIASLRQDPQGKAYAQILLDLPVPVPAAWLAAGGPLEAWTA